MEKYKNHFEKMLSEKEIDLKNKNDRQIHKYEEWVYKFLLSM